MCIVTSPRIHRLNCLNLRLTKLTELLVALGFPVLPKCTAGAPMMEHVRAYMGFFDIKYSLANILLFYYRTDVLR